LDVTRALLSLWRDAVPLSVAHFEFAPPDLLRRYERLRKLKGPLLGGPGLWARQLEEEFRKNPNIFNKFHQSLVKWSNAKRENLYSIQNIIIKDIEEGYIKAVGYLVDLTPCSHPAITRVRS
jgi:hypothetical protein